MSDVGLANGAERFRTLSDREQQVAMLVCDGLANKEIARELTLCEGTVKAQLHNIFLKLSIQNRGGLIVALLQSGND
jgi:two-component system nitrate/nitrite response regulator NarL